jgi:hypothetical protein
VVQLKCQQFFIRPIETAQRAADFEYPNMLLLYNIALVASMLLAFIVTCASLQNKKLAPTSKICLQTRTTQNHKSTTTKKPNLKAFLGINF